MQFSLKRSRFMSRHDPLVTLKQLLDFVVEARSMSERRTRVELGRDMMFTRAAERLVTVMGEAAQRLPVELRASEPRVAWNDIISTRNRVMHGYDVVDYDILWNILTRELPSFEARPREMIARFEQQG